MSNICTLIVAGGNGRRIGGHKADIELCGKRLIEHVLTRVEDWDLPIFVQVRSYNQVKTPGYTQILDNPDIDGPLSGIIAGLDYAKRKGFSYIISVACDMPFLPPNLVDWLLPSAQQTGRVTIASSSGRLHPLCAIWPIACLPSLKASAGRGELSLNQVSKTFGQDELSWPDTPFDPFFNINTPEDLKRAERIAVISGHTLP